MKTKAKAKPKVVVLTARSPESLVRQLDDAARLAKRSRTAEMLLRLELSFASQPQPAVRGR